MRVIYDGPLDGVEFTVPGQRAQIVAARGEAVEVPSEFGEALIQQDTWKKAPEPKKPAKADTTPEEED